MHGSGCAGILARAQLRMNWIDTHSAASTPHSPPSMDDGATPWLMYCCRRAQTQMHLVLATRADPPCPYRACAAGGQLVELYESDLRFTSDEAAQFLNQVMGSHDPSPDPTSIPTLGG